jgi:SAM-dependent methyltransferase
MRPFAIDHYDPSYYADLFRAEDRHVWFTHRNAVLAGFIRRAWRQSGERGRVLEVGCGTGNVLRLLERECCGGQIVGMEMFTEGLTYARHRVPRAGLVSARIEALPFNDPFQLIGMFDVLEHISDDGGALTALRRVLAPGGRLLATVPAHASLWSAFDEASGHVRRYRIGEFRDVFERHGFLVEFVSYFMAPLYPAIWLTRRLMATKGDPVRAQLEVSRPTNLLMSAALAPERWWLERRGRLPFGTSLLIVAAAR